MTERRGNVRENDWDRFGLDNSNIPRSARTRATGGFVDLGSENENTRSGAHPSGADEVFANEQGEVPWWRSNFFISQPILFGKWDGVFTTTMVNIFGVIVFLRSGWIVAQAGILHAILVVVAAVAIALVSVLSAIGIVERIRVETGGVYFLIANTLGSRFGGSLGLLYCFGQAVGCALNVLGFGESICGLLKIENQWAVRGFAIAAIALLATINVAGVKWVIKLQFLLLIILLLSALDFMVGSFITDYEDNGFQGWGSGNFGKNMMPAYDTGVSWFGVFGIFFPTITGVLSGINMSGDLRSPTQDIPNGTLAALSTSTFLYMTFIIFLGATVERETLRTDYMIASHVSAITFLLMAGIYVSSTSSALGCMYGTPRVLQSIAKEATVPKISLLAQGKGPNKVPLNAMIVVAAVVIVFIMVGDINSLAPIVTIPFIFTYACIDYSYFALAQTFDIQTKREERYRIQAQSPLYETRSYGATVQNDYHESDLDQLFPDRVRHKNLTNGNQVDHHEVVIRNPTNSTNEEGSTADDEPIHPIRQQISQKTKNWYSGFCNRWASILGAGIKIFMMFLVNFYFAIICLVAVFLVWFYVGTVNIGSCIPGIASEFRFFVWLKNAVFQCFGKKVNDYEQVLVTPHVNLDLTQTQLNEENEDFSSRRRYHQTLNIQGQLIDT